MSDYLQRLVLRGAGGLSAARAPAAPVAPSALIEEVSEEAPVGPAAAQPAASADTGGPLRSDVAQPASTVEPALTPRASPPFTTPAPGPLPVVHQSAEQSPVHERVSAAPGPPPPALPVTAPPPQVAEQQVVVAAPAPAITAAPAPMKAPENPPAVGPGRTTSAPATVAVAVPGRSDAASAMAAPPPLPPAPARDEPPPPSVFIGRIDIGLVSPPPAQREPVARSRGFAHYSRIRRGLGG